VKIISMLVAKGVLFPLALLSAASQVAWADTAPTNLDAANGPITGDVSLYAAELACQQKIATPGYFPSLNGAEISDA
jgi:hypothetical protein